MIRKTLRYLLRIAGTILCLLLLIWFALVGYVQLHKRSILDKAEKAVKTQLQGDARIGSMDISFFRDFPSITVRISAVSLRDSAWQQHHHDLLNAADIYISCNLWKSLFNRSIVLGRVALEHGQIYFYTDSTGYTNAYLLQPKKTGNTARSGKAADLPDIELTDIHFVMEHQDKHKLFDLDVHHLTCAVNQDDRQLILDLRPDIHVNSFSFNTEKGSYIKGKHLGGHFSVAYNTSSKIVQFAKASVAIDGHPYTLTGRFFPSVTPDPYFLDITADNVLFHQASALLTSNVQQKIDQYDVDKPVSVHATLDAGAADDPEPQIQVQLTLEHGNVETPPGRFTDATFKASFTNEWIRGHKRGDENSAIRILAFTGTLLNLPLQSDTVLITDLKHPKMSCDLHSHFNLEQLNDITGSQTLQFTNGSGNMDLTYKGPLSENDTAGTTTPAASSIYPTISS
jgi:hypothetical protein